MLNLAVRSAAVIIFCVWGADTQVYAQRVDCAKFEITPAASEPLRPVLAGRACHSRMSNGFPIPDPKCTPGAVNPTVTVEVLQNLDFRTPCLRNHVTTEEQKNGTYESYATPHPAHNRGVYQICELDHLVPLELGGADTLDNIWPQCGPKGVPLVHRYFKKKDIVENYLAKQVRDGVLDLKAAQQGIASDWTQYLNDAEVACPFGRCR